MPDIDILIKATDQASAPIKKVEGEMKNLGTSAKTTSTGLSGLQNVLKAGLTTALVGTAAAMAGLGVFLTQSLGQARAQIEADKQLEQVIKSTGGAAGVTAKQAQDLATSLMNVTNFGDDAIESGQSLLLTFTGIGKDVFPRATETMLDMSQALGQDLKSSAIQLGKALNDPVQGISALSRVGVSFTEQQKEMIKTMVEAGNTAGAQGVILDELGKEFGGSAKAMADPVKQLQNAWGELEEGVGMALVPLLNNLAQTVLPYVQSATAAAGVGVQSFLAHLKEGDGFFSSFQQGVHDMLPADMQAKWDEFSSGIAGTFNTIKGQIQTDMGWIKLAWDTDWGDIHTTWTTFATQLPDEQRKFWVEWHKAFSDNSTQNVNDWQDFLGAIFGGVTRGLSFVLELLTGFLGNWNRTTAAWHALTIGDWTTFWSNLGGNFTTAFNLLLSFADIFDHGLKDGLTNTISDLKGIWNEYFGWLENLWKNLSSIFPAPPSSSNGGGGGGGFTPSGFTPPPVTAQAVASASNFNAGGISVTQHFYGQTDPPAVQNASQDGVLNAARRLGLK